MDAEDQARILDRLRTYFRERLLPYNIRHPSGEVEDEAGIIHPGFRTSLPRVEHSDGWSLTDLFLSPEFPDAHDFPPAVRYRDTTGEADLPREIPTIDGERRRVLHPGALHWVGEREGEPMGDDDRTRIMERIRSAYDEWGYRYDLADWRRLERWACLLAEEAAPDPQNCALPPTSGSPGVPNDEDLAVQPLVGTLGVPTGRQEGAAPNGAAAPSRDPRAKARTIST